MIRLFSFSLLLFFQYNSYCQKFYKTTGGEVILSRPISNSPFLGSTSRIRVSAFLHYNYNYHFDLNNNLGWYSGFSLSNIGFAYNVKDTIYKKRVYALGIPLAIKIGNMAGNHYLFGGGEIEFPFHFKQKKIIDSEKNKYSAFFDRRTNVFLPSVFAGIQLSDGLSFKFRFYLKDFLNKNFKGYDFGADTNYKDTDTQLFLISMSYNLKQNKIRKIARNNENRYAYLNTQ